MSDEVGSNEEDSKDGNGVDRYCDEESDTEDQEEQNVLKYLTCITRKHSLRSLSLSYQKKNGRGWPCPSFFCYDTDFVEFESFDFIDHIL